MGIHHAIVFVNDMDRSLKLFQDIIGFKLLWRIPEVADEKLAAVLGMENMKAEIAYLTAGPENTALELVRLEEGGPEAEKDANGPNSFGLSFTVQNADDAHERLQSLGWSPFTEPMEMMGPKGETLRLFFFKTEEGLLIEILQRPS